MGTNKIRDTIITAFEVTRATENKVPMLLLSNPGLAKTSIVNEIGEHYGYHVVSLQSQLAALLHLLVQDLKIMKSLASRLMSQGRNV